MGKPLLSFGRQLLLFLLRAKSLSAFGLLSVGVACGGG